MIKIPAGTSMYFGAPAKPMSKELSEAITAAVSQVSGIKEAHLPQCFISGGTEKDSRQILVIGLERAVDEPRILNELSKKLKPLFPAPSFIDIFPMESSQIMPAIREAGCQIFGPKKKQWWRFW